MKAKHLRVVLPMLTAVLLLGGCGTANTTQKDILDMLNTSDTITIELSVEQDENQGYKYTVEWIQLGDMTSSKEVRSEMDSLFGITGNTGNKNGVFYVNETGENTQNNTLAVAMRNRAVASILNGDTESFNMNIATKYTDLDVNEEKAIYCAISDYFELLSASDNGESNINDSLSRAECMSMVFKAMNPVDTSITENEQFNNAVGENDLNIFAAQEEANAFINTADGSLNSATYTQNMTKAEFIYMVMNSVFGSQAVQNIDSSIELAGLTNAGNIRYDEEFAGREQVSSAIIKVFVNDPTKIDETLYKSIVLAKDKGIITSVEDLDSAITKADAVEILCKALMQNQNIEEFNYKAGTVDTGYEYAVPEEIIETEGMNGNAAGDLYVPDEEDLAIEDEATLAQQEAQEADEQLQSETVADYTIESMDAQTMYAQQSVNLRQGPSTEYDKVGSLSTNQSVTIIGYVETASGKWYQLSTEQFVSAKYLGTDKVVVQAPSNNSNTSNNNNNSNSNNSQSSSSSEEKTVTSSGSGDGSGSSRANRSGAPEAGSGVGGGNLH